MCEASIASRYSMIHFGPDERRIASRDLKIKGEEITGTVEVKREGQPVRIGKVALKRP